MDRNDVEQSRKGILEDFSGRKNLLISFGGIRQGIGLPVFEFFNSIANIDCDKILLRDFNQAWYQKGVDSYIVNFEQVFLYLKSIIEKNEYEKICFLGNSMGGYGAVVFGTLLNVDKIIAFAPQSFINIKNKIKYFDYRWIKQISSVYTFENRDNRFFDLKQYLKQNDNYVTEINLYYSSTHRLDRIHSERLKGLKNLRLHPVSKGGHSIVKDMRDNGELYEIIVSSFF